jgi:hypothetical protein
MGVMMDKNSINGLNHNEKPAIQDIKNPFLRLMKWIEGARKSNTICKG